MELIQEQISQLKQKGAVWTNDYKQYLMTKGDFGDVISSKKTLLYVWNDHGCKRLLFYTIEENDLCNLIAQEIKEDVILEIIERGGCDEKRFAKAGLDIWKVSNRFSTTDCSGVLHTENAKQLIQFHAGHVAKLEETAEINDTLWRVFDFKAGHLLSDEELSMEIEKGEIILERFPDGRISTLLQTRTQPQRLYINIVYNAAGPKVIHSIMMQKLNKYCGSDGKYLYAWIDEGNIASEKFHAKYGLKPDGMVNTMFRKR